MWCTRNPPAQLISHYFLPPPRPPLQVPVEKDAELCNFIRIEQKKKEKNKQWRTEGGGGGVGALAANQRTAMGQAEAAWEQ